MLICKRATVRLVILLVGCLLTAGCGGLGKTKASSSQPQAAPSRSAPLPAGAPPGLAGVRGRVLVANEMKGFVPHGRRALGINAASWAVVDQVPPGQRAALTGMLERLGFVAGLREDLIGPNHLVGLSTVEQFRSVAAARAELRAELALAVAGPAPAFAVSGIPGARGFGAAGSGFNVAFADGRYFYLVGAESPPPGVPGGPTRASVIAAAQHLYGRVQR